MSGYVAVSFCRHKWQRVTIYPLPYNYGGKAKKEKQALPACSWQVLLTDMTDHALFHEPSHFLFQKCLTCFCRLTGNHLKCIFIARFETPICWGFAYPPLNFSPSFSGLITSNVSFPLEVWLPLWVTVLCVQAEMQTWNLCLAFETQNSVCFV